jgi:hypothetical protein
MKLRKKIAIIAIAAAGFLGLVATGAQANTVPSLCNTRTSLCLNDTGGGGAGTAVRMYGQGLTNDSFTISKLTGYCNNGNVSNSLICPFWNGSGWNSALNGGEIAQIKSNVTGWCIGTDGSGNLNLGTCPPSSGGGGSNIWVLATASTCNAGNDQILVSVYWVNHDRAGVPNNRIVTADGGTGSQPFVEGGDTFIGSCFNYGNH